MRIMALDYGSKTVGVALTDELGITASGLETITREKENHLRKTLRRIDEIIRDYNVGTIILGLPKNMDDTLGERALKSLEFKKTLEERTSLPVFLWDERLTTAEASEILDDVGVRRSEQKKYIDKIAAAVILEDYMANRRETDPEDAVK